MLAKVSGDGSSASRDPSPTVAAPCRERSVAAIADMPLAHPAIPRAGNPIGSANEDRERPSDTPVFELVSAAADMAIRVPALWGMDPVARQRVRAWIVAVRAKLRGEPFNEADLEVEIPDDISEALFSSSFDRNCT